MAVQLVLKGTSEISFRIYFVISYQGLMKRCSLSPRWGMKKKNVQIEIVFWSCLLRVMFLFAMVRSCIGTANDDAGLNAEKYIESVHILESAYKMAIMCMILW